MCGKSTIVDELELIYDAHQTATELLAQLRLPVRKAMDLGTPTGFDRAVATLAVRLRSSTRSADAAAVREAIAVLDVDWRSTTAEQRRRLIAEATAAAGRATAVVPRAVEATFGPAAEEVVDATRTAARQGQGLAIAVDFNALDRRILTHLRTSQTTYVRDEYGRRHRGFSERARGIVADGLEQGLGRDDIARDLQQAAESSFVLRSGFYWETVAGSFVGQGRSFAQLSSLAEAGLDRYVIEAVLDERTTEICRFLHGKTFSVASGLRTFERLEQSPEALPELAPWVREAIDPDTGHKVLFVDKGGERVQLAEVTRSGFGSKDDRGEHGRHLSEREMSDLGVSFPPYHGLCRSQVLGEVR